MSALRLGVLPDGTRDVRPIDDGAVGRMTFSRYGRRNVGGVIVTPVKVHRVIGQTVNIVTPERQAQLDAAHARYRERNR